MIENINYLQPKKIQVFLATYNRPHLIEKTIDSILNQSYKLFELIISDNSTNDDTSIIINKKYVNQVKYIHRIPTNPQHFNLILNDVTSDYFMIFHDDDTMHSNMLEYLCKIINERKEIVAVGANARIIENGQLKRNFFYKDLKSDITIYDREQIIKAYSVQKFVPLPGYLYRREVAEKMKFNTNYGRKNCDAAFIIDLLTLGPIVFVARPLMDYYKHKDQDSKIYDFIGILKLIGYIRKSSEYHKNHPLIIRFRIQNIYAEMKYRLSNDKISVISKRYLHLIKLLIKYSITEFFPKIILLTIYYKLLKLQKINQK